MKIQDQILSFTVSMNAEEKKAGNSHKVETIVSFENVTDETVLKHAMANFAVAVQAQIKSNWDLFIKDGIPEQITFGEPLYAKTRKTVTRPPTKEEMKIQMVNLFKEMSQDEILHFAQTNELPERLNAKG